MNNFPKFTFSFSTGTVFLGSSWVSPKSMCIFWAKKKPMCLKVVASNLLLISKAWGSTLPWLPKQWCCARDGVAGPLELEFGGLRFAARTSFYSQVLGATFMMNQLVVFDIQSLVSHSKKHGQNGPGNPSERDVMSTCDDSPRSFRLGLTQSQCPSFVQRPKPPERLRPGRLRAARAARVKHGPWWLFP